MAVRTFDLTPEPTAELSLVGSLSRRERRVQTRRAATWGLLALVVPFALVLSLLGVTH
jgi:hypothetical protein